MKLLAADTATPVLSVAVVDGRSVLAELTVRRRQTHARNLMRLVDMALDLAGATLDDLDGLVAVRGPGSFTGLRIGLSTLKGLALGSGKPVVGVCALEVLARQVPLSVLPVHALVDARKGQVFRGAFRWAADRPDPIRTADAALLSPEAAAAEIVEPTLFVGNGARLYGEFLAERLGDRYRRAPDGCHTLRAATAARAGAARFAAGESGDPAALIPRYLRKSDAELAGAQPPGAPSPGSARAGFR